VADALARFEAAYAERVGAPPPPPPPAGLRALEALIAPLWLPDALRRWWERFGPLPMGPNPGMGTPFVPELADPALAYYRWRAARDRPGHMPEALLAAAVWGPTVRFVDLTDGGTVYDWTAGTATLAPRFAAFEDWIEAVTDALLDEATRVLDLGGDARWADLAARPPQDPGLPSVDLRAPWPERWRDASARFDGRRITPERELSISELLWSRPGAATVWGLATEVSADDTGSRLRVLDGTGWLDAWCPADVPGLWLVRDANVCELDVTLDGAPAEAIVTDVRLRSYG
jgi:hypothetical protein